MNRKFLVGVLLTLGLLSGIRLISASEITATNPFEFRRPAPKVADAYVKQANDMIKAGNKNVKFFIGKMQAGWDSLQKEQGKHEPSDVFIGCALFQIDGPKSLDEIDLVHTALVLAGGKKEKGKGNYKEADARALVNAWTEHQYEIGYKLWHAMSYYGASCYKYVHSGFIVMPSASLERTDIALDK